MKSKGVISAFHFLSASSHHLCNVFIKLPGCHSPTYSPIVLFLLHKIQKKNVCSSSSVNADENVFKAYAC